ncbi:MAG: metal-dependent hydrolase, beta-lactamase superfamily III, partial [Candidatus Atelocyanobacterium thalassa isolate SIO64986]
MPTVKIVVAGSNMIEIPVSLEQAVSQAKEATKIALEAGVKRICIEIIIPEIALQSQDLTLEFISIFENK